MLEMSALHACAAAPAYILPSDLFGEGVRVDDLIVEPIRFDRGYAIVSQEPRLGVELVRVAREQYRAGDQLACEPSKTKRS